LNHPFSYKSFEEMKQILNQTKPQINNHYYSNGLVTIVLQMLSFDLSSRLTIQQLVRIPFIKQYIQINQKSSLPQLNYTLIYYSFSKKQYQRKSTFEKWY
jgi:hypothetical protein